MSLFRRFFSNDSGATAMLFGLTLVPVAGLAGAAMDYSRAATTRSAMQGAADATSLMLARDAGRLSQAELERRGRAFFDGMLSQDVRRSVAGLTITRTGKQIRVAASGTIPTTIMRVLGEERMAVGVESTSVWGTRKIELALVLDNTGSMDQVVGGVRKIDALKDASRALLDTLEGAAYDRDAIKVSVVPFDTQVNIGRDKQYQTWLRYSGIAQADWTGCVADRGFDLRDETWYTSDRSPVTAIPASLHPAVRCAEYSGSRPRLAQMRELTSDFRALRSTIDAMTPSGCTNITVGAVWGQATLSAREPLTGAVAPGSRDVDKIMILLTDGDNTRNAFRPHSNCTNPSSRDVAFFDASTRSACESIKADNVKLYTIRVINGNAGLLRDCASSANLYFDVQNVAQLTPIFQAIAAEISAIRLTQ